MDLWATLLDPFLPHPHPPTPGSQNGSTHTHSPPKKASPPEGAIRLLRQAQLPHRPAASQPARAWERPSPVSATQTAAAPAQSRSRLRKAPNQRAAPLPGRARARWAPNAGACALRALVRDSWRRRQRRGWRRRPGVSRRAGVRSGGRVGWAGAAPDSGPFREGGISRGKARSGALEKRGRLEAGEPRGRAKYRWRGAGNGGLVPKERFGDQELGWGATWKSPQFVVLGGGDSYLGCRVW